MLPRASFLSHLNPCTTINHRATSLLLSSPQTQSSLFTSTCFPKQPSRCPAKDTLEEYNYPTASDAYLGHGLANSPLLLEPAYIKRYRDPSRHDSYTITSHQDPYEFRTRPTVTQAPPRQTLLRPGKRPATPAALVRPTKALPRTRPRIALCFPGSSSQYIGMGSFLAERPAFEPTWEEAEQALVEFERWRRALKLVEHFQALGYSERDARLLGGPMRRGALAAGGDAGLREVVFKGPQNELTRSSNAQPAILITSIAYLRALEADCATPIRTYVTVYAGHSSGEYTACVAAGALDFATAVKLTRLHGLLTTRALELAAIAPSTAVEAGVERRAQMSALLVNAPAHSVADVARVVGEMHAAGVPVEVASVNSGVQVVLSGTRAGVLGACERLQELEIANRAADLPCASPFHSSFMKPAAQGMKIALESIKLLPPTEPILISPSSSFSSSSSSDEKLLFKPISKLIKTNSDLDVLKNHLAESVEQPVWWSETIKQLVNQSIQDDGQGQLDHHHHQWVNKLLFVGPGRALRNLCVKEFGAGSSGSAGSVEVIVGREAVDGISRRIEIGSVATEEDFDGFQKEDG